VARAGNRDCGRRSREGMAQSEVRSSECQCSAKAASTKCRAHNHDRSKRSSCYHAETKSARTPMFRAQFHVTISPIADGVAKRQEFSLCALVQVCASLCKSKRKCLEAARARSRPFIRSHSFLRRESGESR